MSVSKPHPSMIVVDCSGHKVKCWSILANYWLREWIRKNSLRSSFKSEQSERDSSAKVCRCHCVRLPTKDMPSKAIITKTKSPIGSLNISSIHSSSMMKNFKFFIQMVSLRKSRSRRKEMFDLSLLSSPHIPPTVLKVVIMNIHKM